MHVSTYSNSENIKQTQTYFIPLDWIPKIERAHLLQTVDLTLLFRNILIQCTMSQDADPLSIPPIFLLFNSSSHHLYRTPFSHISDLQCSGTCKKLFVYIQGLCLFKTLKFRQNERGPCNFFMQLIFFQPLWF